MKFRIATFTATAIFALLTAITADAQSSNTQNVIQYKKNGGYVTTTSSESTAPNGTAKSSKAKVNVSVDSKGYVTKEETEENVINPKGLGNQKKNTQQVITEEKPNGGYAKKSKTIKTDAEGTDVSNESETNVNINDDGDVTATSTSKDVVDQEGLLNKKVMKKKLKMINGKVVEEEVQTR